MSVLIGVPTAGYSRNDSFYDYFNLLDKPSGTAITFARGQSPARNRNLIIDQAILNDFTHILFIDDDIAFRPDLLSRLMTHNVEIVTALYLMRNFPHQPIIFDHADEQGRCRHHYPAENESGLIPIVACGLGACLIKTEIFKFLEKPYIRLGELEKDHWCDDIGFFKRVRAASFPIFCDLDTPVGHMSNIIVNPVKEDGKWFVTYDTNGTGKITIPALVPIYVEPVEERVA